MVVAPASRAALRRRPARHGRPRLKILVLGRSGQLARSLAERAAGFPHFQLAFAARPEFDLRDERSIRTIVGRSGADVVVNAAAYTAVDQAEGDIEGARLENGVAPGIIASAAREAGARLVHVSTDYVFDGQKPEPYVETDPVAPISVYGRTKLEGEEAIREALPEHLILRTAWVYSPWGKNFVKTMLGLAQTRDALNIVDDQTGSPTSALDLADGILAATEQWRAEPELGLGETYHLAGQGAVSWARFAEHIFETGRRLGGPSAAVSRISTAEYPTPARRPAFSILDSGKFRRTFAYEMRRWQEAADEVVGRLLAPSQDRTSSITARAG